jgi:hypothetical protein
MITVTEEFTGADMKRIREAMGLSIRAVASFHNDRAESNIREMEAGKRPIPEGIAAWFVSLEKWLAANPPVPKNR